jgi:hypothetical protein
VVTAVVTFASTGSFAIRARFDGTDTLLASSATATATVTAPTAAEAMTGAGFIFASVKRHEFAFSVRKRVDRHSGYLQYSVRALRRRGYHQDRFRSTAVTAVSFTGVPRSRAGRGRTSSDQAVFEGVGLWNGHAGYTFEARALDGGEPGRGRDVFTLTIRNPAGGTVAALHGTIDGGDIQLLGARSRPGGR